MIKPIKPYKKSMIIDSPCAVDGLPEDVYHADPCVEPSLSSTMAKTLLAGEAGPARLKQIMDEGFGHKSAFVFGSAAHEQILNRGIKPEFLDADSWRSKAAREWRDEVYERGGVPLLAKDKATVEAMAEQILAHPFAGDVFTTGAGCPEYSMFTIDKATGRWQRGRLDFLASRELIIDYKTTGQSCELADWVKHSYSFGYRFQAAQYLAQATELDLVDADAVFVHVVQETKPPYLVACYQVSPEELEAGRKGIRQALDIWDRCLTTGDWPGVPKIVRESYLPAWATNQDNE